MCLGFFVCKVTFIKLQGRVVSWSILCPIFSLRLLHFGEQDIYWKNKQELREEDPLKKEKWIFRKENIGKKSTIY